MRPNSTGDDPMRPKYYGKYPGLVLDNEPKDGKPPGMLSVQVMSFQERDPADAMKTRYLQVDAMPCMAPGSFIIPDKLAPVWVEFAAGDPRTPLWTGAFYSAEAAPLNSDEAAPTQHQRLIRSVAGNLVLLDDTADAVKLVLKQPDGNTLTMSKDGIVIQCGDNKISVTSDSIRIEAASKSVTLEQGGVKINGQLVLLAPLLEVLKTHVHDPATLATLAFNVPIPGTKSE